MGWACFYGTTFLSITLPASVSVIAGDSFSYAKVRKITTLGNGPKNIQDYCMMYCELREINFGKNLENIGGVSFYYNSYLEKVSFNADCNLVSIGGQAFAGCSKLKSIVLPKKVKSLKDRCFQYASVLATFSIPAGSVLSTIEDLSFDNTALTSISFPKTLTFLGVNSFQYCKSLKSVTFAAGTNLPTLGGGVFKSCTSLPTITIPSTVSTFDPSAFAYCSSLVSIYVPSANTHYTSRDGIVYTYNKQRLVCCPAGKVSAFIYNYIIVIGSNAFWRCTKLQNLTFQSGCKLETIEDGTFYSCTALVRVDLPTSLKTVKQNAFAGCTKLAIITFPDYARVNLDADSIFSDCTSLTTFTFGKFCALKVFGKNIFSNCKKLTTVVIPANCTTIRDNAFKGCQSLKYVKYQAKSKMSSLSSTAFSGCTSLTNYSVPDSYTQISSACFGGAPSITIVSIPTGMKISKIVSTAFSPYKLKSITIASGTTISFIESSTFANKLIDNFYLDCKVSLSSYVFKNCSKLKKVYIKQISNTPITSATNFKYSKRLMSATKEYYTIPTGTFYGCNNLESVTINNNIVNISDYAFTDCSKLVFKIPSSVKRIGNFAFKNCFNINKVPENVIYFGNSSFIGTSVPSVLRICSGTKFIGSSSFMSTKVRVVYYCGSRDFSKFYPSFERGTNVIVGLSYKHNVFCGSPIFHKASYICDDIIETNFVGVDIIKKQMKNDLKTHASLLLTSSYYLGLW